MSQPTFNDVLETVDQLSADEQADLVEIVLRRLNDAGHQRLVDAVRDARAEFARGEFKEASVDELMREITS